MDLTEWVTKVNRRLRHKVSKISGKDVSHGMNQSEDAHYDKHAIKSLIDKNLRHYKLQKGRTSISGKMKTRRYNTCVTNPI